MLDTGSVQGANLSHLFGFVKELGAPAYLLLVITETDARRREAATKEMLSFLSLPLALKLRCLWVQMSVIDLMKIMSAFSTDLQKD